MRLVMTLLVRNEEDILEAHLAYHLAQGIDFFIITDHNSTDRTPDILSKYRQAGVAEVLHQSDPGYYQGEWVTSMARRAATEYGADWVINSDADEFWWPCQGDLRTTLEAIPASCGIVAAPRHNFRPNAEERGQFVDRMTVRDAVSTNYLGESLPPKVCHRGHPDVVVAQGNHDVHCPGFHERFEDEPIIIFHYPIRSYRQFERKIANGGPAWEKSERIPLEIGKTWRVMYDDFSRGKLFDYYQQSIVDEDRIRRGVEEGTLLVDVRVRDFLRTTASAE